MKLPILRSRNFSFFFVRAMSNSMLPRFNIFGGFTTEEWKSSTSGSFFGSRASTSSSKVSSVSSGSSTVPSTFLFSIRPQFRVCRPTGVGQNFLYYTAASRTGSSIGHTSTGNAPVGIGFGGQLNFFRLFLDEDLRQYVLEILLIPSFIFV